MNDGVIFVQLAGQVLALFGIKDLAKDQGRPEVVQARNFATEAEVDAPLNWRSRQGREC